jgi:hypothetical protein
MNRLIFFLLAGMLSVTLIAIVSISAPTYIRVFALNAIVAPGRSSADTASNGKVVVTSGQSSADTASNGVVVVAPGRSSADTASNGVVVVQPKQSVVNPTEQAITQFLQSNPALAVGDEPQGADVPAAATALNTPWRVCAADTAHPASYSTFGVYSLQGTAKVNQLDSGQQRLNITVFNNLDNGIFSAKIIQDDSSEKSVNLNLDRTNAFITQCIQSNPQQNVAIKSPSARLPVIAPPFRSCLPDQQGVQSAVYTIRGLINTQDIINKDQGKVHLKINVVSDLITGWLYGNILVDEKKFGQNDPVKIGDINTATKCSVKPIYKTS